MSARDVSKLRTRLGALGRRAQQPGETGGGDTTRERGAMRGGITKLTRRLDKLRARMAQTRMVVDDASRAEIVAAGEWLVSVLAAEDLGAGRVFFGMAGALDQDRVLWTALAPHMPNVSQVHAWDGADVFVGQQEGLRAEVEQDMAAASRTKLAFTYTYGAAGETAAKAAEELAASPVRAVHFFVNPFGPKTYEDAASLQQYVQEVAARGETLVVLRMFDPHRFGWGIAGPWVWVFEAEALQRILGGRKRYGMNMMDVMTTIFSWKPPVFEGVRGSLFLAPPAVKVRALHPEWAAAARRLGYEPPAAAAHARRARQPGGEGPSRDTDTDVTLEDLPDDMLREISDRLPPGDARSFSGVSSAVRAAVRTHYTPTDRLRNTATARGQRVHWRERREGGGRFTAGNHEGIPNHAYLGFSGDVPAETGRNLPVFGPPRPPGAPVFREEWPPILELWQKENWPGRPIQVRVLASIGRPIPREALALLLELVAAPWELHRPNAADRFTLRNLGMDYAGRDRVAEESDVFDDLLSVLRDLQDTNPDFGKQTAPRRPRQ